MFTLAEEYKKNMTTNSDHEPQYISTLEAAFTFLKDHPQMPSDLEMNTKD
jgi:hypothetical protein